jgi:hypothetical protein
MDRATRRLLRLLALGQSNPQIATALVISVRSCYNRYMPKLFVDKTIEINAPASKVWDRVLPKVKALAEKEQ